MQDTLSHQSFFAKDERCFAASSDRLQLAEYRGGIAVKSIEAHITCTHHSTSNFHTSTTAFHRSRHHQQRTIKTKGRRSIPLSIRFQNRPRHPRRSLQSIEDIPFGDLRRDQAELSKAESKVASGCCGEEGDSAGELVSWVMLLAGLMVMTLSVFAIVSVHNS